MSNPIAKTILITGATAGIGRATALYLAHKGHHVIATGRNLAQLDQLVREAAGKQLHLETLALDVTNAGSIANAVAEVDRMTNGRGLDVLVNNAGFGALGPSSEITDAEMRRQYETNVFGLMNVTRAFLPKMRERRAGRVINVSSLGGRFTMPFFGVYNSTKYAVESLSDALRMELRAFGIDIVLIEPGVIRTNFEATAVGNLDRFKSSAYAGPMSRVDAMSKKMDRFAAEPIVIARAIDRAVSARRPAARYVAPRFNNLVIVMKTLLPTSVFDWSMRKMGYLTKKHLGLDVATPTSPIEPTTPPPTAKSTPAHAPN